MAPSKKKQPVEKVEIETPRPYKVLQQLLCITAIDFEKQSLLGYTEITLIPLKSDLKRIFINCGKQLNLYRVTVDDFETEYCRRNPTENFLPKSEGVDDEQLRDDSCSDGMRRDLKFFSEKFLQAANLADPDQSEGGELEIQIPNFMENSVKQLRAIKIGVEFSLEKPTTGVQFVISEKSDSATETLMRTRRKATEDAASSGNEGRNDHLFTYRSISSGAGSRHIFPCVDTSSELCMWKIEITCDAAMQAVCSGELSDVIYTQDMRGKTFHYVLTVPTSAVNIGLAVGQFQVAVHSEMNEITSFCPQKLQPLLQYTTGRLDKVFEFFEELLASRYPYTSYKQVFVSQAPEDIWVYAGLSIFNVSLLFHKRIIDPVPLCRSLLANGVAQQFFGCFIVPQNWLDVWVTRGLARYITGLYMQRFFGNNEYLYHLSRTQASVCDYEATWGPIILRPLSKDDTAFRNLHFDPRSGDTVSWSYVDMMSKKAHLVMRMLERRLGKELLFQVLNKVLSIATQSSQQRFTPGGWQTLLMSTESFFNSVSNVTGQDFPSFMEQWVYGGGHAHFMVNVSFNRKRNSVELEIKQDPDMSRGRMKYTGPMTVVVQELDGSFSHTIQIDDNMSKQDLQCHSKARRQRKRKIPLWTQEEIEMDLQHSDPDSPVLWVRVDPDLSLLKRCDVRQLEYHWQYQLKHEKDILAQLSALEHLPKYSSPQSRQVLMEVLENDLIFYRVRMQAAFTITEVANRLHGSWMGPPAMLQVFRIRFGSRACPYIPRTNNFLNLQMYFIMQAIPSAMALLRPSASPSGSAPGEVQRFILDLLKFNDNSTNKYSDDYYRGTLLLALAQTTGTVPQDDWPINAGSEQGLWPSSSGTGIMIPGNRLDRMPSDVKCVVEEIVLALNLEKLKPSYGKIVTVHCLRALRTLQKRGHVPQDPELFWNYFQAGQFQKVRIAAVDCLADLILVTRRRDVLDKLVECLKNEKDPGVRYHIARQLSLRPPFHYRQIESNKEQHHMNTKDLVHKWRSLMGGGWCDQRVMTSLVDAYAAMYGRKETPFCLSDRQLGGPAPADFSDLSMELESGELVETASETEQSTDKSKQLVPPILPGASVAQLVQRQESAISPVSGHSSNTSSLYFGAKKRKEGDLNLVSLSDEDL